MKIKECVKEDLELNEDIIFAVSKVVNLTCEELKDLLVEEGLTRLSRVCPMSMAGDQVSAIGVYIKKHYLEDKNE